MDQASIGPHQVFIGRHGETEWNLTRRRQGRLDSPLTAAGQADARRLAVAAAAAGVSVLYSSPLGRALRTAEVVSERIGIPVVIADDLTEIDHGAFTGLTTTEIAAAHPTAWQARSDDLAGWRFPEGESYLDGHARATSMIAALLGHAPATTLLVTHEMIGRMLLAAAWDISPADLLAQGVDLPHGQLTDLARPPH